MDKTFEHYLNQVRGNVNETMNFDDLKRVLTQYTEWMFKNQFVQRTMFMGKLTNEELVNKFVNKFEGADFSGVPVGSPDYQWMSLPIPSESNWFSIKFAGEPEQYGFTYMDTRWHFKSVLNEFMRANVGKTIKFKWTVLPNNSIEKDRLILPTPTIVTQT